MCTVSYIPRAKNGFILSSNRDETPMRAPEKVAEEFHNGHNLVFPKDRGAGGTWIVLSDKGQIACVLNGAFVKHKHRPPYRRSRGLMIIDIFYFKNIHEFTNQYCFDGMEPFTLIWVDGNEVMQITWTGTELSTVMLNSKKPYIWSSSTLYTPDMQADRRDWFEDWLNQDEVKTMDSILSLHKSGGVGNPYYDYVMDREIVKTISISQVEISNDEQIFRYEDLISGTINHYSTKETKVLGV